MTLRSFTIIVVFNEDFTPGIQKESPCKYVELKVDNEPNIDHIIAQNPQTQKPTIQLNPDS